MKQIYLAIIIMFLLVANIVFVSAGTTGKFTVTTEAIRDGDQGGGELENCDGVESVGSVEEEPGFFEKIFDWFFGLFEEEDC